MKALIACFIFVYGSVLYLMGSARHQSNPKKLFWTELYKLVAVLMLIAGILAGAEFILKK